jgi:hypothetical protein
MKMKDLKHTYFFCTFLCGVTVVAQEKIKPNAANEQYAGQKFMDAEAESEFQIQIPNRSVAPLI